MPVDASTGDRSRGEAHALVRVQGRTIAIPGRCVTQAVPAPDALTPLPRRAGGIEGVMSLRGRVLPVVGLARWLDAETPAGEMQGPGLVLLLEDGEGCTGLAVEAVVGVKRVRAEQVHRLFHDDSPEELFQSAALFDGDSAPTSILEPRRLMALAGVWVADSGVTSSAAGPAGAVAQAASASASTRGAATVAHATFRIGDAHVALPAVNIGELLPRVPLRRELPAHDGVLGLCEWRERLVPVIDLTVALGALPVSGESGPAAWQCIVCDGDLAIGLVLHEVLDITRIAPDAGTPEASADAADAEPSVIARRLVTGERTLQVIDVAALMRRYSETDISRKGARDAQLRTTADPGSPAYMVFDAGGMFAAHIDGVQEVVAVPAELRPRLDAGLPATLQWRNQPVPVRAIGDSLVTLPAQAARQLVIVRWQERLSAFAITGVKALVPRGIALRNRMRLKGRPVEVISVETEGQGASYPVIDLGTPASVIA